MFNDRKHAGTLLVEKLADLHLSSALVLGLPRGGVVVASVAAKTLGFPLDVLIVKKIPSPIQAELGIGALAPDNVVYMDWKLAHRVGADEGYLRTQNAELNDQIKKKILLYRKGRKPLDVRGKTVIVVDDGAATGATLEAAIRWLRKKNAKRIIAAIPVASREVVAKIKPEVSDLIVLEAPSDFSSVGQFYKEFPQIEDSEVVELLR